MLKTINTSGVFLAADNKSVVKTFWIPTYAGKTTK